MENEEDLITAYSELVVQFGHVIMFSSVFPAASFFILIINWISYYSILNDFKYKKRANPSFALGIGEFGYYLQILSHLSIVINLCIVYFTSNAVLD